MECRTEQKGNKPMSTWIRCGQTGLVAAEGFQRCGRPGLRPLPPVRIPSAATLFSFSFSFPLSESVLPLCSKRRGLRPLSFPLLF